MRKKWTVEEINLLIDNQITGKLRCFILDEIERNTKITIAEKDIMEALYYIFFGKVETKNYDDVLYQSVYAKCLRQKVNDMIDIKIKESLKPMVEEFIKSEEFIDNIVDRIKRKQLCL